MFDKCMSCWSFSSRFSRKYYYRGRGDLCFKCFIQYITSDLYSINREVEKLSKLVEDITKLKNRFSALQKCLYPPY